MTTVTLEVPDDLAARINAERQLVPELLRRAFAQVEKKGSDTGAPLHQEVVEFLADQPALERIADFKISRKAQQRLDALLRKNRAGELSEAERQELDSYLAYRHVLILLKASARRAIKAPPL